MRRRVASAVVVAAVAAVGMVALVDLVRPLEVGFGPGQAAPLDPEAAARLAELGVGGTLVYTGPGCGLHALALPELVPTDPPAGDAGCEFSVSPDGRRVGPASARWSREGKRCDGACAWRGEELTRAIDGEIRSGAGVLVPRVEVEDAARRHPNAPRGRRLTVLAVRDLAWLSQDEVVALVAAGFLEYPPRTVFVVAGFRRGRLASTKPYFGRFERLVVSPAGEVLPEPPPVPSIFVTGRLRLAGPFAWSPDGRRMAIATRASVVVVDLPSERHVRIPVTARDLAWR